MDIINDAARNIANRLTWHTAGRDQAGIAQELAGGEDIPEVYGLGEAGLFYAYPVNTGSSGSTGFDDVCAPS